MQRIFKRKKNKQKDLNEAGKSDIAQGILSPVISGVVPSSSPKSGGNTVQNPPSPDALHRPHSVPVINTAPWSDLPPHLEHGESLLDYGSQLVSETDFGYSTVHDAIVHVNSTRRRREERNEDDYQHRPLPAVPLSEYPELPITKTTSGDKFDNSSTLTSVTPTDQSGSEDSESHMRQHKKEVTVNQKHFSVENEMQLKIPVYAQVNKVTRNKSKTNRNIYNNSRKEDRNSKRNVHSSLPHEMRHESTVKARSSCKDHKNEIEKQSAHAMQLPEFSDSSDESLLEDLYDGEEEDKEPQPSSPLSFSSSIPSHRPPPSPSPGGQRQKNSNYSTSKRTHSSSSHSKHNTSVPHPLLTDLPVYNLNQSSSEGYILTRTDPDGKMEYFTATPILSPTPSVPFTIPIISPSGSLHTASFGRSQLPLSPGATSTPLKLSHNNKFPSQQLSYDPITPPTTVHNDIHAHSSALTTTRNLTYSQPSLPITSNTHFGGLSEINKVLLDHETSSFKQKTSSKDTSFSVRNSMYPTEHPTVHKLKEGETSDGEEKELSMKLDAVMNEKSRLIAENKRLKELHDSMKEKSETITVEQQEKLSYLRKENNNLKESVTQLSNELSLHPLWGMNTSDRVTLDELIQETPKKLKRVLDSLTEEISRKDEDIDRLKTDLVKLRNECSSLSAKNKLLEESQSELQKSSNLERKAIDNSFTHISKLNEDLQHQIEALSNQMIEVKRENRIKVEKLKAQIKVLQSERDRFQREIESLHYNHSYLEDMLSKYTGHHHHTNGKYISMEEHEKALKEFEQVSHQETTELRKENHLLNTQLAALKGHLLAIKEEYSLLKREKRIYQERASQFQQDLEHSQERELLAVQQLNESVTHAEMALAERDTYAKMTHLHAKEKDKSLLHIAKRKAELEELNKKLEEYKNQSTLQRQQASELFHDREKLHKLKQRKSKEKIHNLESLIHTKDRDLDTMARGKRHAERQLDWLWQSTGTSRSLWKS